MGAPTTRLDLGLLIVASAVLVGSLATSNWLLAGAMVLVAVAPALRLANRRRHPEIETRTGVTDRSAESADPGQAVRQSVRVTDEDRQHLRHAWEAHRESLVPQAEDTDAWSALMLDDSSIAGVVTTILDGSSGLTVDQRAVLSRSIEDLDRIAGKLSTQARDYAVSLRAVAAAALAL